MDEGVKPDYRHAYIGVIATSKNLLTLMNNEKSDFLSLNNLIQDQILETTQRGFIGLAQQNQELVKLNKQLTQQLETVVEELNQIKQEPREKEMRKQTRANRKRLPQRDPMTAEIYK